MIAWVLEHCGYQPGFLVGGVLGNFGISARLGESMFFVVEADEYDSAFSISVLSSCITIRAL